MPNRKAHIAAAATVTGIADLAWQLNRIYSSPEPPQTVWEALGRINVPELFLATFVGGAVGLLPDILEPATSPNHRKFCHSVVTGGAIALGAFGEHTKTWTEENQFMTSTCALGYLSHLYLDCLTPKGLPLI